MVVLPKTYWTVLSASFLLLRFLLSHWEKSYQIFLALYLKTLAIFLLLQMESRGLVGIILPAMNYWLWPVWQAPLMPGLGHMPPAVIRFRPWVFNAFRVALRRNSKKKVGSCSLKKEGWMNKVNTQTVKLVFCRGNKITKGLKIKI